MPRFDVNIGLLRRMDWLMALVTLLLLAIGIAFIYSAEYAGGKLASSGFYQKQIIWAGIGILFFVGFAMIDYHELASLAWLLYAAGILLLIMVLMPQVGQKVYGARRWVQLAGFRLLQPSELMKPALIILLARLFGWPGRPSGRFFLIAGAVIITLLPVGLILKQPDLGTALIFLPILGSVMFAGGVPLRVIGAFVAAGAVLCCILIALLLVPQKLGWSEERQKSSLETVGISAYQRERMLVFFDSDRDPLGAGWNRAQSEIAVGSGRFWGKGYGMGTQNILGFLPRTVAPNDFIFSVIAEEKGFSGSIAVLLLFMILLGCCVRVAFVARDRVGMLICVGITTMLFCHVFINVGMTIGLLPVTGTPLPLISYGGTFLVGVMGMLGIVQSIYVRGDRRLKG